MNTNQFFTYIPSEYFVQKDINSFVNKLVEENQDDFLDKFYLNNLTDKKLVRKVFQNNIESKFGNKSEGFTLLDDKKANYYVELEQPFKLEDDISKEKTPMYFKLAGYDSEGKGVYTRISDNLYSLNKKKLNNYSDTNELVTNTSIKLKSLVESDRKLSPITESKENIPSLVSKNTEEDKGLNIENLEEQVIESDFDLNSLDYGNPDLECIQ